MKKDSGSNPMFFLSERLEFPLVENANAEGLLAVGGDLSSKRLLLAYQSGIFHGSQKTHSFCGGVQTREWSCFLIR